MSDRFLHFGAVFGTEMSQHIVCQIPALRLLADTDFDVMDALADKYNISISENKHKALCGKGVIEGIKVVLAKPQTYMNLSGESVAELVNYYKLDPESELIVVFDDTDIIFICQGIHDIKADIVSRLFVLFCRIP